MSDETLQELKRRWAETNDPQAEAAYLRELVRLGELAKERLALAAYLGHPPASVAQGGCEQAPLTRRLQAPSDPAALKNWIQGLAKWEGEVLDRAAIALARFLLPLWHRHHPRSQGPRRAVEAAESFVLCPCLEHRAALEAAHRLAGPLRYQVEDWVEGQVAELEQACSVNAACLAGTVAGCPDVKDKLFGLSAAADYVVDVRSVREAASTIRTSLVPWALGRSDVLEAARETWLE